MTEDTEIRRLGTSRVADNDQALLVHFSRCPTDDEMRNIDAALDPGHQRFAEVRRERDDLRVELARVRTERDEARSDLVKAMQTLELNAPFGPTLYLCDRPSLCACCGRTRKDGRRDRGWKNVVADVNAQRRFSVRIAFCAKCFEYLEARAAKHIGKEQREQPGELEEAGRG